MPVVATELPFFVHVFGAMLLVGGLGTAFLFQLLAWRRQDRAGAAQLGRFAFRTLLFVALPSWFVMRIGAQWVWSAQGWEGRDEPTWLGIGWVTAEAGGLFLLVGLVLAGLGARRMARAEAESSALLRVSTVLVTIALLAYVFTAWAMSAKPG